MAETILKINHLSKSFGNHEVLRDIDFTPAIRAFEALKAAIARAEEAEYQRRRLEQQLSQARADHTQEAQGAAQKLPGGQLFLVENQTGDENGEEIHSFSVECFYTDLHTETTAE